MSQPVTLLGRTAPHETMLQSRTAAYGTAGLSVTAKFGRLYRIRTINAGAAAYFLQIHDKATAPTAGNTPVWEARLPASGEVDLSFELIGLYLANGLGLAISTTTGTLTLAAANDAVSYLLYTASK